jgi:hypothetical protein
MPYVTLAVAAVGAISAYDKSQKAKKGIEKLKDWKPRYKTAEEVQREADATIREGFTPQETASFRQSLARRSNQAYQTAVQRNPNLASAVQAGINYGNIGALTDFAARDAQLRRQRVQDYIGRASSQYNQQTNADLTSKRMQEQAYGLAKSQAEANIYNSLTMAAYGASRLKGGGGAASGDVSPITASDTQIPMQGAANQPIDYGYYGSNQWAKSLYGNPNQLPPPPYFGTTQFGATKYPRPLGNSAPSASAPPYQYNTPFFGSNYYGQ